jgi:hypothetical protein
VDVSVHVVDGSGVPSAQSAPVPIAVNPALVVAKVSSDRPALDVGQSVSFLAAVTGGSGNDTVRWTGTPPNCTDLSAFMVRCWPTDAGPLSVTAVATDSNGVRSTAGSATVVVSPALTQAAVGTSASRLTLGQSVTLTATAQGGSGSRSYRWIGLPPGCNGTGPTVACQPSDAGQYEISVQVNDSNRASATSAPLSLEVEAATGLALSPLELVGIVLTVAVVLAVVAVLYRRGRPRRLPPAEPMDAEPDPPSL